MPREATIVRAIRTALLREPGVWFVKYSPGDYGTAGVPDLLICYWGRFVGMEVKQPGQRPTKIQQHTLDAIAGAGGIAIVATSVDEALECLRGIP